MTPTATTSTDTITAGATTTSVAGTDQIAPSPVAVAWGGMHECRPPAPGLAAIAGLIDDYAEACAELDEDDGEGNADYFRAAKNTRDLARRALDAAIAGLGTAAPPEGPRKPSPRWRRTGKLELMALDGERVLASAVWVHHDVTPWFWEALDNNGRAMSEEAAQLAAEDALAAVAASIARALGR